MLAPKDDSVVEPTPQLETDDMETVKQEAVLGILSSFNHMPHLY